MRYPSLFARLALAGLSIVAVFAADPYKSANTHFGVSGGNVNDSSKAFCCSGTLGSLVTDGPNLYILSNNHVLARSDQAQPGEDISQPGLIDNGCRIPPIVADFTRAPRLGTNVDAAIAQLRPATMDPNGVIEGIGGISSKIVLDPTIGLPVAKSGRTTGTTTGAISLINTTVRVQYQRGCGSGKKFTITYANQIVISGNTFSAGGDSGSLIVTNDQCHQPVGLLFAGSSTTTIANPISEVLDKIGGGVSFVGGKCTARGSARSPAPSQTLVNYAAQVARDHEPGFLSHGEVIGVGVGSADDNPYEAVIVVYIDRTQGKVPDLPDQARGVRIKRVMTDPIIAGGGCCKECR